MRLLGIDYGEKNVGIALSDDRAMMAFPHSVMRNTSRLAAEIAALAKKEGVSKAVMGDSMNYKGEANRIMKRAAPFAEELRSLGLEVVFEPEVLSSHQAAHFMGKTGKIDASAASIILQSYIDYLKANEHTND